MSIINDALKKAEGGAHISRNSNRRIGWIFWLATIAVCLLVVVWVANSWQSPNQEAALKSAASANKFAMRSIDTELPLRHSEFNLSGILYDEQEPFAIINHSVIAEGASIDGAMLLDIQPNYVKLSYKGKEIILGVQ